MNYLVDLDGTLAEGIWPKKGIGKPIEDNVDKLEELYKAGKRIFIYTARPMTDYDLIKKWAETNLPHIEIEGIITGKPLGIIVDDRSLHPDETDWA